jgi:hypothetical protein
VLDGDEHIQTTEQDRVHVEQVAGHDPIGLSGQELLPGGP